uniref:Uncharacterized protein n=1 Tax=Anguilla anguilla TaxID=7936 RepID=A0A0E9PL97_ANGAN
MAAARFSASCTYASLQVGGFFFLVVAVSGTHEWITRSGSAVMWAHGVFLGLTCPLDSGPGWGSPFWFPPWNWASPPALGTLFPRF